MTVSQEVAAQFVHLRDEPVRTDVALDLVDPVHGEVEPVVLLIFDQEEIVLDPAGGQLLEAPVAADALLGVNDEIPLGQFPEGLEEIPLPGRADPPPEDLLPEDLLLGEDDEVHAGEVEASADPALPEEKGAGGAIFFDPVEEGSRRFPDGEVVPREELAHPLHALLSAADEDDPVPLREPAPDLLRERPEDAGLFRFRPGRPADGDVPPQMEPDGRTGVVFGPEGKTFEMELPHPLPAPRNLRRGQIGRFLFQMEPLLVMGLEEEPVEVVFDLLLGLSHGERIIEDEEAGRREVVEERAEAVIPGIVAPRGVIEEGMEQGIHRGANAGCDHLGEFVLHSPGEFQLIGPAADVVNGPLPSCGREDHLPGGEEHEFGELLNGTLRGLVEDADRFQFVAEELQAKRVRGRRGVEIDHVPPDAELPPPLHERDAAVTPFGQLPDQFVPLPDVAHGDPLYIAFEDLPRNHLLHEGAGGNHHDGRSAISKAVKHLQAGEFRLPLEGKHVRRQKIPGGQENRLILSEEEGEIPDAGVGLLLRWGNHDEGTAELPEEEGHEEGAGRPLQTADGDPLLPAAQPLQQPPQGRIARILSVFDDLSHRRPRRKDPLRSDDLKLPAHRAGLPGKETVCF